MIERLKFLFSKLDIHTAEVVRKSAASTIVKVIGMMIGLGVSIFLGRTLGADGLGIINLSNRIVQLVIIIALLGMRQVIIKEVAIARNNHDGQHIGNVMYTAYLLNGGLSLIITVLMILATPWLTEYVFHEPRLTWPLIIAIIVMMPQVFSRIFSSGFIGYKKIWQSNLVDQTLSMGVIGLLLIGMRILEYNISINRVAVIFAIGRLAVTLSIGIYWRYLFRFKVKTKFIGKRLLKTALPLFLVSTTTIVAANTSVIVLGWLGNASQVGLFTVASQIALLTVFFLQVTNSTIAPKLAVLYAAKKVDQMQTMVQEVTGILLIIATVSFLTFIFAGKLILAAWGSGFTDVYYVLIIISFGQFVNIATGAGGLLLIMSGFEKVQSRISLFFVVLNIVLNFILIYYFGILGAAIATATTMAGENITRVIYAKRFVGVLTLPVNIFFK